MTTYPERVDESGQSVATERLAVGIGSRFAMPSRRRLLAGLTSGLLAAGSSAFGTDEARARTCPPCRKKKRGRCKRKRPNGTPCGEAKSCQAGRCAPCVPPGPGSPFCTPGATPCCIGRCVLVQPDVHLCVEA